MRFWEAEEEAEHGLNEEEEELLEEEVGEPKVQSSRVKFAPSVRFGMRLSERVG